MGSAPDAAVAIVRAAATQSVLLIRRAERAEDPWSGHWSFPGGRRDASDADLLHTALRELWEECAIRIACEQLLTALPPAVARRRVGRFLQVAPFVFSVDDEIPAVPDPREAVEAVWVPLRRLRDPARHVLRHVPGVPPEILFPAIELGAAPLWGFTYRLITAWLDLLPNDPAAAGFHAARTVLHRLIAHGCQVVHEWQDGDGPQVAAVRGAIPVDQMLAELSIPGDQIPHVNMVEVYPDRIRIVGLAFEEYIIRRDEEGGL
ncbi:MAG: CoA pyrophosphatase [Bryobacteraceae bacterium]|jgi:8-oxo-dGTP pyrophosphatase MutT (NUDIX family)